jgi:hypothetical protein
MPFRCQTITPRQAVERSIDQRRRTESHTTSFPATKTRYRDAIENEHIYNMNKERGFVSENHGSLLFVP